MLFRAKSKDRPYLIKGRLPNVLAALQVMARTTRSERAIKDWAHELDRCRNDDTVKKWTKVFDEHREVFLTYWWKETHKAALRWRYATRFYDAKTGKPYTLEEKEDLHNSEKLADKQLADSLTTEPLNFDQIATLINAAIELHRRQIAERTAAMWWVPVVAAFLGFLGAVGGVVLTAMLGIRIK